LERESKRKRVLPLRDELAAIRLRYAKLPDLDNHSPEEIIGYDEHGLLPR
jgi:antitoxin VapB